MPKRHAIWMPSPGLAITPPVLLTSGTATRSGRLRSRLYMIKVERRPVSDEPASSFSQCSLQAFHGAPFISSRSNWWVTRPASSRFTEGFASRKRAFSWRARCAGLIRVIGTLGGGGGGDGCSSTHVSWCVSPEQCSAQTSRRSPQTLKGHSSSHSTETIVTQTASQPYVARQCSLQPEMPPISSSLRSTLSTFCAPL